MNHYIHYVSGFFAHREQADDVFTTLLTQGLPRERMQIYSHQAPALSHGSSDGNNEVLKDVLVDGAIGAGVGIGVGTLVQVALITANVTLFVASPLIAPLALLGWGASVGGVVGASIGASENAKSLSALIDDAIKSGQIVLVVETRTDGERTIVQDELKASIGDYNDINASQAKQI